MFFEIIGGIQKVDPLMNECMAEKTLTEGGVKAHQTPDTTRLSCKSE
jgi:hypothetical protein